MQLRSSSFARSYCRSPPATYRLHSLARRSCHNHKLVLRTHAAQKVDASSSGTSTQYKPSSAKDAVESGLRVFKNTQDYEEAVRLFSAAMDMSPSEDEAGAALYNLGCSQARLKRWPEASAALVRAINDYKVKLSVALEDPDLQQLRDRREWLDALTEVKGGLSRAAKVQLRSEVKTPFRLLRVFVLGGLSAGAALGLLVISTRLIAAVKGGEGAPDLSETATNFGINAAVLAVLGFFLRGDLVQREKAKLVADREELLSRLQIDLGKDRQLPLLRLRGQVRPVIVAGSREFVERAIRAADKSQRFLRERGVSVVPVIFDADTAAFEDPADRIRALKREFQAQAGQRSKDKGFGPRDKEVAAPAADDAASSSSSNTSSSSSSSSSALLDSDKRWRLVPHAVAEWREWVLQQGKFAKLESAATASGLDCYIQVQLDGTVRASGLGVPPWGKLVEDLPELDSVRTKFSDGIGTDV